VMWSETSVGLRTRPVWDQRNRSWSRSWSCRSGVVLWKTHRHNDLEGHNNFQVLL